MSERDQTEGGETEEEEDEHRPRRRIQRYKPEEMMYHECEEYVKQRKRLPILHSRWLLNRYANAGYSLQGVRVAFNYTEDQLREAQETIKQLRERVKELEEQLTTQEHPF